MNNHESATATNSASSSIIDLFSLLNFMIGFIVGIAIGTLVIVFTFMLVYWLFVITGIDGISSFATSIVELIIVLGAFSLFMVLLSRHIRSVGRSSIINLRCGFLGGLTVATAIVSGLCVISAITLAFGPSGTSSLTLERAEQAYATLEGNARGYFFEQIALNLSNQSGRTYNEAAIIKHLGLPDLVKEDKKMRTFAYFYDRFGKKDWVVYVDIDRVDGKARFGFNESVVIDHSSWKPYVHE